MTPVAYSLIVCVVFVGNRIAGTKACKVASSLNLCAKLYFCIWNKQSL